MDTNEKIDGRKRNNLSPEERERIGRLGGLAVSSDRMHMAHIGHKGGIATSRDTARMAEIARKGRAMQAAKKAAQVH